MHECHLNYSLVVKFLLLFRVLMCGHTVVVTGFK